MDLFKTVGGLFGGAVSEIAKFSPLLGRALAFDIPGALGEVVKLCGGNPEDDKKTNKKLVVESLKNNPDLLLKMKKAELKLKEKLSADGVNLAKIIKEREEIEANDRDSARKRQIIMKDYTPSVIAFLVIAVYVVQMGFLFYMSKTSQPVVNKDAMGLIGTSMELLKLMLVSIIGYYFGSSSSSRNKDEKIARMSYQ